MRFLVAFVLILTGAVTTRSQCCSSNICAAQHHHDIKQPHKFRTLIEHLALGAGTEIGIAELAGGPRKYAAGITAGGVVAGFKEGADAVAGRDSKKKAALHALMILAGAGITAAIRHR